jgi:hypothetical protein
VLWSWNKAHKFLTFSTPNAFNARRVPYKQTEKTDKNWDTLETRPRKIKLIQIYIQRSKNAVQHAHKSVTSLTLFFFVHFICACILGARAEFTFLSNFANSTFGCIKVFGYTLLRQNWKKKCYKFISCRWLAKSGCAIPFGGVCRWELFLKLFLPKMKGMKKLEKVLHFFFHLPFHAIFTGPGFFSANSAQ